MGFILLIIAIIIAAVTFPFGILWTALYYLFTVIEVGERYTIKFKFWGGLRKLNDVAKAIAYAIDVLGNVVLQVPLNYLFITKESSHKFGSPDESISAVLGFNKRKGTLTKGGQFMDRFLHLLDPYHVEKAADWEDKN